MALDFFQLSQMRKMHPAWRLLQAEHAPLIASFLNRAFTTTNRRTIAESELISRLEDELDGINMGHNPKVFPKAAKDYLTDWAAEEKRWIRKFYPQNTDEAHYDITPAAEKAMMWLESLQERSFVGTESKLMTAMHILEQIIEKTDEDAESRIEDLEQKKRVIDDEIARIRRGVLEVLDDTGIKDRFFQFQQLARELLGDFREVEHNFRQLDSSVREQIMTWDGTKGDLLDKIFGERDLIEDSDQGRSFRAFWLFLMDSERQDELSDLLKKVFDLEAVQSVEADIRLKRVHYDWLEAGEYTQRTVSRLSSQLRTFLDNQSYLEHRRIAQTLDSILKTAIEVKNKKLPDQSFTEIDAFSPTVALPMEKPLFSPPFKVELESEITEGDGLIASVDALYRQFFVDREMLKVRIRDELSFKEQVSLKEIVEAHPLEKGLSELVTYLSIAEESASTVYDESCVEWIEWKSDSGKVHKAKLPRVIYNRSSQK